MKNEPNCQIVMAHGVRNHKFRICEHNLHSEHLILHIWALRVGTQLTKLLSGVPDALWVRFVDLKMTNEPNCHIIMAHEGQKSQNSHLWKTIFTLNTWYFITELNAFRCSGPFMSQICESKPEKWARVWYNCGSQRSKFTISAFVNKIFTLNNTWYFICGHSGWVP